MVVSCAPARRRWPRRAPARLRARHADGQRLIARSRARARPARRGAVDVPGHRRHRGRLGRRPERRGCDGARASPGRRRRAHWRTRHGDDEPLLPVERFVGKIAAAPRSRDRDRRAAGPSSREVFIGRSATRDAPRRATSEGEPSTPRRGLDMRVRGASDGSEPIAALERRHRWTGRRPRRAKLAHSRRAHRARVPRPHRRSSGPTAARWHRRGAQATQIAWAKANGYTSLQTSNEVRNEPIRHLNERYGYVLEPGVVIVRAASALPSDRLLDRAPADHTCEVRAELCARGGVGRRIGALRHVRSRILVAGRRAPPPPRSPARASRPCSSARSGRPRPSEPFSRRTSAATPTVAQSCARRLYLRYDQPVQLPSFGTRISVSISSGPIAESKTPLEEVRRRQPSARRPGPGSRTRQPSASITAGRSDAGSQCASEPPIVPRWRTCGSPISPAVCETIGQCSWTSGSSWTRLVSRQRPDREPFAGVPDVRELVDPADVDEQRRPREAELQQPGSASGRRRAASRPRASRAARPRARRTRRPRSRTMRGSSPCLLDRPPDPLGSGRHVDVGDAVRRERVERRRSSPPPARRSRPSRPLP